MTDHVVRERCIAHGMFCKVFVQLANDRPKGRIVIEPKEGHGYTFEIDAAVAEVLLEG